MADNEKTAKDDKVISVEKDSTTPTTKESGGNSTNSIDTEKKSVDAKPESTDMKSKFPNDRRRHLIPFNKLPPEEMKRIASLGGKAGKGKKRFQYTYCVNCEMRSTCARAYEQTIKKREAGKEAHDEDARCVYEIEGRINIKRDRWKDYAAFMSSDPKDLIAKILLTWSKLEKLVEANPSFRKYMEMMYFLVNLYKTKFGEKLFVASVHKDISSPTLDIKKIMSELREEAKALSEKEFSDAEKEVEEREEDKEDEKKEKVEATD